MSDGSDPKQSKLPAFKLDPSGRPCKICTSFRDWTRTNPGHEKPPLTTKLATAATVALTTNPPEPPSGCPPDVEQLGRATWTFLHATASYFPEKPTVTERANMIALLRALPVLYPCGWCAMDFGRDLKDHPPDVSSRAALSRWLCERHNTVNVKLGKERFDCSKVMERWKDGPSDGRCG